MNRQQERAIAEQRAADMASAYAVGKTLADIGSEYGISRERVRQILSKYTSMTASDGGVSIKRLTRLVGLVEDKRNALRKRKIKAESFFGCDFETLCEIHGSEYVSPRHSRPSTPALAFRTQKRSAKRRGIPFLLTLPEWWRIWKESGHFEKRGRGNGYCMTRIGDTGAYEVGNVEIKTIGENFSESYFKTPWHVRFPNKSASR